MTGPPPVVPEVSPSRRRPFGLLSAHLHFLLFTLALLAFARVGLMSWQGERVGTLANAAVILVGGLRMDTIAICYVLVPAFLAALMLGGRTWTGPYFSWLLRAYLTLAVTLFAFFEITTPSFVSEYDSRPNRLFVEYLVHPREVSAMLWNGYRLELFLASVLTAAAAWLAWRYFGRVVFPGRATGWLERSVYLVVGAPLLLVGMRSTLQHRPANPSSVVFSADHLLNDLCLSSFYSVSYAVHQMKDEADAGSVYGKLESEAAVFDEVRRAMVTVDPEDFTSAELPTLHRQTATYPRERPLNLVILLEESLGAQFVGALGGEPVTQFLDTLRDEGWWFDRMYATGTRSVRGIEAVVSGFLPTPARSTVKLGLSQKGFFTLADFLGRQGYRTQFVYGGESHFDNMKRFFTGNGFKDIVDRDDFQSPEFEGSWGVCDEDIFRKAHETFLAYGDEPFFSLVFSVSNHSPWEYPTGGFEPFEPEPATRNNSVRYADHALRTFFDLARQAPYWDNTVFVVVADHDSRVYGASLVPIPRFHIPAVILGPGIEPRRDGRIVSQIDLGPTLLSLIGVSGEHPMVGFDLTTLPADHPGRAIMQYGGNQAFLEGDRAIVLQPGHPARQHRWDGETLVPMELNEGFRRRALAHALLPSLLYRTQRYRLEAAPRAPGQPLETMDTR